MAIITWNDLLVTLILIIGLVYYIFNKRFSYWKDKNVSGPKPSIPFGNAFEIVTRRKNYGKLITDLYNEYKHLPFIGMFMVTRKAIVVNDLELIRSILTKDFEHFSDHGVPHDEEKEPISGHLFNLTGEKWKNLRGKLTPTFTSSKMRSMFDILAECAMDMSEYLEENLVKNETDDVKEILAKFGTDVIANCAFGIECKSFKNPNDKFRKMGKKIFDSPTSRLFIRTINFLIPRLAFKLNLRTTGREVEKFFLNLVKETVDYRENNGIVRNDFMQLLIELKNKGIISPDNENKLEDLPDDGTRLNINQIAAQAFVFFIGGFETSSTTGSFALYELALNPDIQETLIQEIDKVLQKHNGKVTYNSLGEMTYLSKVIEETLRKHPPLPVLLRACTKSYTIPGTNILIEKGTSVNIPILGIQRNPDIFPDPDKFDPERFSPENKAARHNFAYLPFGEGPRVCIGNRFGLMQTKLGLVTLLSKYRVSPCDKTLIPLKYNRKSFLLAITDGIYLKISKRMEK